MSNQTSAVRTVWDLVVMGGFTMIPLVICSLVIWAVILERLWTYRKLSQHLRSFHLEAMNAVLRDDLEGLRGLIRRHALLPTARLAEVALERFSAKDSRLRSHWEEAVGRARQLVNQELRSHLWILGTIGSSAPFIGLFGTVVGILRSFQEMARSGSGGFAVVSAGISESLVATAAGIVVAVIGVMAFNSFQTYCGKLILLVKIQTEELLEVLRLSRELLTSSEQGSSDPKAGQSSGA
ncbi:MAG: MotA/TolQ/ExbB proton channel family protein [Bdellovibrionia bacterium]